MNVNMLKIMELTRSSKTAVMPAWLVSELGILRPSLTRALQSLVAQGDMERLGRGTYVANTTAAVRRAGNREARGILSGRRIVVASRWSGLLAGEFGAGVQNALAAEGAVCRIALLDSGDGHWTRLLDDESFDWCEGAIIYEYRRLNSAFLLRLANMGKPMALVGQHRNLAVDTVAWNATQVFEEFADLLLDAGCSDLVLVEPFAPDDPLAGIALRDQLTTVSGMAACHGKRFHFLALNENEIALNFGDSELKNLALQAGPDRKLGVICWRPKTLYTLVGLLSSMGVRLNRDVFLCGMDDGQSPKLLARAQPLERGGPVRRGGIAPPVRRPCVASIPDPGSLPRSHGPSARARITRGE